MIDAATIVIISKVLTFSQSLMSINGISPA